MKNRIAVVVLAMSLGIPRTTISQTITADVVSGPNGQVQLNATGGVQTTANSGHPSILNRLGTNTSTSAFSILNAGQAELLRVGGDGKVGVGMSPVFHLDVLAASTTVSGFRVTNPLTGSEAQVQNRATNDAGANAYFGITSSGFSAYPPLANGKAFWMSYLVDAVFGAQTSNRIVFTQNGSETARFDTSGNLGLGTTTPIAKLDVRGNINVSGNINAKYQDIAEWVPASEVLPPGTVVVLDPGAPNTVRASRTAYDSAVAGVVTEMPGLLLGDAGPDKAKIATTGRVRVRVDARQTPVRIGDLLVTSDAAGMAMRSVPISVQGAAMHRPGTVIGKALEPLAGGTGEILVLLSLQ